MGLPSHGHATSPASGVFRSGDVLDNRYRIEHVIAEGGVAIVVAAEQLGLDRHVAIKLLRPETLADRELVEHFKREGSLAAKIKSEHVVRIHDVGEGPGLGPYMVMELLDGHDLEQRLASGPLPVDEAVDYVMQACDALAEAHHLRIVHRDVKPANLFIATRSPRPPILKLIDFGISKLVPRGSDAGARSVLTAGTPAYMSPEQIQDGAVDARADIWALGVVLQELVTGSLPFPLDAPERMLKAICTTAPIPLRAVRPDLPAGLEAIVLKCLARHPEHRYPSVTDLARELQPYRGTRDAMKSSGDLEVAHAYTDPRRQAPTVVVSQPAKGSRSLVAGGIAIAIALAGAGVGLALLARSSKRAVPATTSEPSPRASFVATAPPPPPAEPPSTVTPAPAVVETSPPATVSSQPRSPKRPVGAKPRPITRPTTTATGSTPNDRSMFGERK